MSDDYLTIVYLLGAEHMRGELHKQADEIERLRAENEKLRAALKPFAESCEHYTDEMDQDHYQTDVGGVLTVGNFRDAAAVIKESGDE